MSRARGELYHVTRETVYAGRKLPIFRGLGAIAALKRSILPVYSLRVNIEHKTVIAQLLTMFAAGTLITTLLPSSPYIRVLTSGMRIGNFGA